MHREMFMKDIPPVSPPPTPGKDNAFQEKPSSYRAEIIKQADILLERLMDGYMSEPFYLDDIKNQLEDSDFSIDRTYLTHLVSTGVLDYDEEKGSYSINHASPEVQERIG
jgi:hypothetical protein